jgi:hypothetical protein
LRLVSREAARGGSRLTTTTRPAPCAGLLCHRCNRNLPSWVTPLWLVKAAAVYLARRAGTTDDRELRSAVIALYERRMSAARGRVSGKPYDPSRRRQARRTGGARLLGYIFPARS